MRKVLKRLVGEVRGRIQHRHDPYRCQEIVELVTDYVEGAMDANGKAQFEYHLDRCPACVRYVDQVRSTIDVLGHVHPPAPQGDARAALMRAFHDFSRD